LQAERERAVRPADRGIRDWQPHVDAFLVALTAGDETTAGRLARTLLRGGLSPPALCEHLVAPALRAVGERWADGELSVSEEHRCSAICSRLLGSVARPLRGRPRGRAVVLTAPGDRHRQPALMATIALRQDRWRVDHLDIDVPRDDLVAFVEADPPDLVVISSAYPPATRAARRLAAALSADGLRTLVGGPGATLTDLRQQAASERPTAAVRSVPT
jgi:methanogenic corrinoid protein MtbC1